MKRTIKAGCIAALCCIGSYSCDKDDLPPLIISIESFTPVSGSPGVQVTITGTNFSDTPKNNIVRFNGTAAQVIDASGTELIVTVPVGASTGKITVQNSLGTATSAGDFQVISAWTEKKVFTGPGRRGAAAFAIGNKGYFGTGITVNAAPKDFWEFDPVANTWTQKADFPGSGRWKGVGFSIGNKGYIGLGNEGSLAYMKDFYEYDPVSNSWTRKADFRGTVREQASAFSIGDKGYVGLGNNTSPNYLNDFYEYNPANNTWTQKANFGGPARVLASGFSVGSKGYIAGGWEGQAYTNDFWEYDPLSNGWTKKAGFPGNSRGQGVAFSIGMKGYFGTGFGTDNPSVSAKKDFWEYNPATNAWTQKAPLQGAARSFAIGFSIGKKGYIGLGINGSTYLNDLWEYEQ